MPSTLHKPSHSNWGDFGPSDQLGRVNLIDRTRVLKGIAEVREGRTFCLSLPLHLPGGNLLSPVRFPPLLRPVTRNNAAYYNYEWRQVDERLRDIAADDCVLLHTQYSTQWDSLAHRGALFDADGDGTPEALYYNGHKAAESLITHDDGSVHAEKLGIEHMAAHGMQGRGVMIDLFSRFGEIPRKEVGYEDLRAIIDEENITIEPGDILCLWTGLDRMILRMDGAPDESLKHSCAVLDGHDERLLQWVTDSGVAAIASDNLAVEAVGKGLPEGCGCGSALPLHEHCLFNLGIPLGELWHLADLAEYLKANHRHHFLLTAPPLRLTGAVGSPVTPIATV